MANLGEQRLFSEYLEMPRLQSPFDGLVVAAEDSPRTDCLPVALANHRHVQARRDPA